MFSVEQESGILRGKGEGGREGRRGRVRGRGRGKGGREGGRGRKRGGVRYKTLSYGVVIVAEECQNAVHC